MWCYNNRSILSIISQIIVLQLRMTIKELQTVHEENRQAGHDIFSTLQLISDSKVGIKTAFTSSESHSME